jgi:hypothetical protein
MKQETEMPESLEKGEKYVKTGFMSRVSLVQ